MLNRSAIVSAVCEVKWRVREEEGEGSEQKKGAAFFDGCEMSGDEREREGGRLVASSVVIAIGDGEKATTSQHGHTTHRLQMCAQKR